MADELAALERGEPVIFAAAFLRSAVVEWRRPDGPVVTADEANALLLTPRWIVDGTGNYEPAY